MTNRMTIVSITYRKFILPAVLMTILTCGVSPAEEMDDTEIQALLQAGLSPESLASLGDLNRLKDRVRPPTMNEKNIMELLQAGLPDDIIRLLIGLDWLTGQKENMSVSPEQVLELYRSGLSRDAIRVMLASEITKRAGFAEPKDPGDESNHDGVTLGRQVIPQENGKDVIRYRAPSDNEPRLGRTVVELPDGKEVHVYFSGGARSEEAERVKSQKEEERKNREWLDRLRIHVFPLIPSTRPVGRESSQ
jgi:hypothetical protein